MTTPLIDPLTHPVTPVHYEACPWVGTLQPNPCYECGMIEVGIALGRTLAGDDIAGFRQAMIASRASHPVPALDGHRPSPSLSWHDAGMVTAEFVARRGYYKPED